MDSNLWRVGDRISRHGPDEQRIVDLDRNFGLVVVVCVKPCGRGCCVVGEGESNLIRRYAWAVDGELEWRPMPPLLTNGIQYNTSRQASLV